MGTIRDTNTVEGLDCYVVPGAMRRYNEAVEARRRLEQMGRRYHQAVRAVWAFMSLLILAGLVMLVRDIAGIREHLPAHLHQPGWLLTAKGFARSLVAPVVLGLAGVALMAAAWRALFGRSGGVR